MPEKNKKTNSPVIGLVGVCASGKSTISQLLQARGYICRHIAQEHSYVPTMWLQLTHPDFLVYLHVSYPLTIKRKNLNWTLAEYNEEIHRLRHAYAHADLIIDTDQNNPDEVAELIAEALMHSGLTPEIR